MKKNYKNIKKRVLYLLVEKINNYVCGEDVVNKSFLKEISFFSRDYSSLYEDMDYDLLGAKMRESAHLLDKDLSFNDYSRYIGVRKRLEKILVVWRKRFSVEEITYKWAHEILEEHYEKW